MNEMITTKRRINTILLESDFGSFMIGFMIFSIIYGAAIEIVKKGKSEALKRKLNTQFRKVGELLKEHPELRNDPLIVTVLQFGNAILEGDRPDPRLVDALEAVKIKFKDKFDKSGAREIILPEEPISKVFGI